MAIVGRQDAPLILATNTFNRMHHWKQQAKQLKTEIYALHIALQDERVPWGARIIAALVIAYALSPIDLIPDFIPILGYLDDLILIPLGIKAALLWIPPEVMKDSRQAAQDKLEKSPAGALIVITIWLVTAAVILKFMLK